MIKSNKGKKHSCIKCGSKFYDLNKKPVICPRCGSDQNDPKLLAKKKKTPAAHATPKPKIEDDDAFDENLDLIDEPIDDIDIDDVMEDVSIEEKEKTDDL